MDLLAFGLFLTSAIALLGSPGPAIASLLAVGRADGLAHGLRYYAGLQVGLALAAGASALGLFSLLQLMPSALLAMSVAAALYLVHLAYKIATAPVGSDPRSGRTPSSPVAGLFLGLSNPKAYVAFLSLFASHALIAGNQQADSLVKWLLCVIVMIVVDIGWLLIGVALKQVQMSPAIERAVNIGLAIMILAATGLAFA